MHFTKMEGLGNDYVYVNCFEEKVDDPQRLARLLSDTAVLEVMALSLLVPLIKLILVWLSITLTVV